MELSNDESVGSPSVNKTSAPGDDVCGGRECTHKTLQRVIGIHCCGDQVLGDGRHGQSGEGAWEGDAIMQ